VSERRVNTIIELNDLLEPEERIQLFATTCDCYNTHGFIISKSVDESRMDIAGAIEETLHRILKAGGTEYDVRNILDAIIPDEETMKELEEYDEYVSIDLGYVIPGLISHLLF